MKIIAVTNEKGGVGKTTMTAHFAAGLAIRGHRVCIIDTDPQGHVARLFGLPEEDGLYQLLVDKADFQDVLRYVPPERYSTPDNPPAGKLFVPPSSTRTTAIASLEQDPFILHERLAEMGDLFDFDVIVMDTAPTASMFDSTIYLAAQAFIYVTACEALSFDGIRKSLAKIERFGRKRTEYGGEPTHVLGILPNMFRANTANHRMNLVSLAQAFPDLVWKPIALRTRWTEASNYGRLVFAYAPSSGEAADAWEMVQQIEESIAVWPQN